MTDDEAEAIKRQVNDQLDPQPDDALIDEVLALVCKMPRHQLRAIAITLIVREIQRKRQAEDSMRRTETYKTEEFPGALAAYDRGELDALDTIALFQFLVDTGLAWSMEGKYGRKAIALIQERLIRLPEGHSLSCLQEDEEDEVVFRIRFPGVSPGLN
jgi:hypothetical protein